MLDHLGEAELIHVNDGFVTLHHDIERLRQNSKGQSNHLVSVNRVENLLAILQILGLAFDGMKVPGRALYTLHTEIAGKQLRRKTMNSYKSLSCS